MMRLYKLLSDTKLYSLLAATALFFIVSCKKQDQVEVTQTLLSVYNFSPTVSTYDAYLNDVRFNSVALPFGGGVKYAQIAAGTSTLKFNVANTSTQAFNKSLNFAENSAGTIYLIGKNGSFDTFYTNDASQTAATDKAYVRFVNLCADAPAMDLTTAAGATITTNKTFKTNSGFIEVTPGSFIFNVKETTRGTQKAQVAGTLSPGIFYSVAVGGNYAPASDNERPVAAFILRHQ